MCLPIWRRHFSKREQGPIVRYPISPGCPCCSILRCRWRRRRAAALAGLAARPGADRPLRALGDGADRHRHLPDVPAFADHGADAQRAGRRGGLAGSGGAGAVGAGAGAGLVGAGLHHQCLVGRALQRAAGPGRAAGPDGLGRGRHRAGGQGRHGGLLQHAGRARRAGAPGRSGRGAGRAAGDRPDADPAAVALWPSAAGRPVAGLRLHGLGPAARRTASDRAGADVGRRADLAIHFAGP